MSADIPEEPREVLEYYDAIAARAPVDDAEWDFVMTASDYRCITDYIDALRAALAVKAGEWGWCIRHVDGRWRTLDSLGMPDWTEDESKALCLRLREHADAYAADDPEDVRIVPALSAQTKQEGGR